MKKTIFNIVQSNIKGGLENVYLDYAKILYKDFELICITSEKFVHLPKLQELGIKTEIINIKGHYDVLSMMRLLFFIKKYKPSLIIAHNGRAFSIVNLYNFFIRKRGFKTMAISHGGNPKRLINFDYIIAVAKHIAENIELRKQNEGAKQLMGGNIFTIHNGISLAGANSRENSDIDYNTDSKEVSNIDSANIALKKNPTDGKFGITFGILSRLSPEKNIITALKSFQLLVKNIPEAKNARLLIAGEGPELENLTKFVEQENLQSNVSFLGHQTDIASFFNRINLLLHPAIKEPFGIVILEAFKHHTPVIGSRAGGLKEIIIDGYNGYLFDNPTCHQSLYNAILDYYLKKRKNDVEIIKNAYKTLQERFSFENTQRNLLAVINKIL